jgi:hypothetical protein
MGISRGQNLVEAALIVRPLLLTFGLIDFGTTFYIYLALENELAKQHVMPCGSTNG